MREILFRGKKKSNGEWIYGDLSICDDCDPTIYDTQTGNRHFRVGSYVLRETVGQYTGLTDMNGKKIFEGDIVKAQDDVFGSPFCDGIIGKIVYDECAFFIEPKNPMDSQWLYDECAVYEVIGNIHDNPELLKGADDERNS